MVEPFLHAIWDPLTLKRLHNTVQEDLVKLIFTQELRHLPPNLGKRLKLPTDHKTFDMALGKTIRDGSDIVSNKTNTHIPLVSLAKLLKLHQPSFQYTSQ